LTFGGNNRFPLWSADGQRIVFRSDREGDGGLFWQPVTGGPAERLAKVDSPLSLQGQSWFPDGKTMLLDIRKGGGFGVGTLTVGGDLQPKEIIPAPASHSNLSPDGHWIAYDTGPGGGRTDVYVQSFESSSTKYQITTTGGSSPLWSRDGKQLFYTISTGIDHQILAVDVDTKSGFSFGKTTPLPFTTTYYANGARPYDISPDGKHFVVMFPESQSNPTKTQPEQINVILNWREALNSSARGH
jgi:Tol biopolymer transport system component